LTRVSIHLRKKHFAKKMDCRVKPGNDDVTTTATNVTTRRANHLRDFSTPAVNPLTKKYFCFSETKSPLYSQPSRPTKGAYRGRHGRGAGGGGRGWRI